MCASYASHTVCSKHPSREANDRKGWIIDVSMVVCGTQNLFSDDFLRSSFLSGYFGIIRRRSKSDVRLKCCTGDCAMLADADIPNVNKNQARELRLWRITF